MGSGETQRNLFWSLLPSVLVHIAQSKNEDGDDPRVIIKLSTKERQDKPQISNKRKSSLPTVIKYVNYPHQTRIPVAEQTKQFKMSSGAPKKYIKINGVMKMNPAYKAWKTAQEGGNTFASAKPSNPNALAVVSSMEDHMKLNEDLGTNIPLAESTDATVEMVQEPEISLEAGMAPDEMVDKLGAILGKYEVPMGLMNKRKFYISL